MFRDADPHSFAAIYVVCGRTDMRYGIDSLAAIIEARYHLPLFVPGTLFLFCGKRDGFLLFTKRVEDGHFSWPRNSNEARLLSPKQFEWLMDGFSIDPEIRITYPDRSA